MDLCTPDLGSEWSHTTYISDNEPNLAESYLNTNMQAFTTAQLPPGHVMRGCFLIVPRTAPRLTRATSYSTTLRLAQGLPDDAEGLHARACQAALESGTLS